MPLTILNIRILQDVYFDEWAIELVVFNATNLLNLKNTKQHIFNDYLILLCYWITLIKSFQLFLVQQKFRTLFLLVILRTCEFCQKNETPCLFMHGPLHASCVQEVLYTFHERLVDNIVRVCRSIHISFYYFLLQSVFIWIWRLFIVLSKYH